MKKSYFLGGEEITEEQREAAKKFSEAQEEQVKAQAEQQVSHEKQKALVTLEQLLHTRIVPEEDRIVVWKDRVSSTTESGLLKPDEAVAKEEREVSMGTVLAVGPGKKSQTSLTNRLLWAVLQETGARSFFRWDDLKKEVDGFEAITLKPGDHIIFGKFAGTPVPDPDTKEELLIMRPMDIFGKIKA